MMSVDGDLGDTWDAHVHEPDRWLEGLTIPQAAEWCADTSQPATLYDRETGAPVAQVDRDGTVTRLD